MKSIIKIMLVGAMFVMGGPKQNKQEEWCNWFVCGHGILDKTVKQKPGNDPFWTDLTKFEIALQQCCRRLKEEHESRYAQVIAAQKLARITQVLFESPFLIWG